MVAVDLRVFPVIRIPPVNPEFLQLFASGLRPALSRLDLGVLWKRKFNHDCCSSLPLSP
jgi:hypothetical protein